MHTFPKRRDFSGKNSVFITLFFSFLGRRLLPILTMYFHMVCLENGPFLGEFCHGNNFFLLWCVFFGSAWDHEHVCLLFEFVYNAVVSPPCFGVLVLSLCLFLQRIHLRVYCSVRYIIVSFSQNQNVFCNLSLHIISTTYRVLQTHTVSHPLTLSFRSVSVSIVVVSI